MKRIAVLASGNGSNFQAIIDAVARKEIKNGSINLLVCDQRKAFCLERAREAKIKAVVIEREGFRSRGEFEAEILRHLREEKIDLICLAGFMRILSDAFVRRWRHRMLNIHPSLLPALKGAHAIRDALKAKVKVTGATVHFVTEELDAGPVILQEKVEIKDGDTQETLLRKVHEKEHKIYPEAVNLFCQDKLKIIGNRVKILACVVIGLVLIIAQPLCAEERTEGDEYVLCDTLYPRSFLEVEVRGKRKKDKDFITYGNLCLSEDKGIEWKPLTKGELDRKKKEFAYYSMGLGVELFESMSLPGVSRGINRLMQYGSNLAEKVDGYRRGYALDVDPEDKEAILRYERKY